MIDPEFGKRLKKERENYLHGIPKTYYGAGRPREKYISQAVLARIVGVSQGAVAEWEKGKSYPKPSRVVQLATLFGVEPEYFIGAIVQDRYQSKTQEENKTEKGSNINFLKKVFENL
jgi:transcriptional regulator with XRE-family HTH domain